MAYFADDIETGDLSKWDGNPPSFIFGNVVHAVTSPKYAGAYAAKFVDGTYVYKNLPGYDELKFEFYLYCTGLNQDTAIFRLNGSTGVCFAINFTPVWAGVVPYKLDLVIAGTRYYGTTELSQNAWYKISGTVKVASSGEGGYATLSINDALELSETGVNTAVGGSQVTQIQIGCMDQWNSGFEGVFDNLIIDSLAPPPTPPAPPDNCYSGTTCQELTIPQEVSPCRSLTTCPAIPPPPGYCRSQSICQSTSAPTPANCRSLTTCESPSGGNPSRLGSLTKIQDIPLTHGEGTFLIF